MSRDSRSLVAAAIRRQPTDRVPAGELCIDDALVAAVTGSAEVGFAQRLQLADRLGLDLICLTTDYGPGSPREALPAADAVRWDVVIGDGDGRLTGMEAMEAAQAGIGARLGRTAQGVVAVLDLVPIEDPPQAISCLSC